MDWNGVGESSPCFLNEIKTKLISIPIYTICALYKSLSIAAMVALLQWYATAPILILLAALEALARLVLKTTEGIKNYRIGQRFNVVFSLMGMVRPGSLINRKSEYKKWVRWESILSSLIHS